ncbi:neugrin-like [Centroberyx affinis]|uniref:neugrin-like n=1 Tax=Centroberyx affinis TaxID=166261 RepID=UPI003A5C0DAE
MARPLRVFSLLSRLGPLSVMPTVSARSCRFASRDARAWTGQSRVHRAPRQSPEMFDDDVDMEDVEDKLQSLIDEDRKRRKTVKYHVMRRQMTPSGAPERKLTWDAMQQIRYLKQEQPEEWTVERLANSFSVSPDVVRRVLRSKFIPTPERKAKQDTNVMARLGQQALSPGGTGQDKPKLPGQSTPAILPSGSKAGELVTVAKQTLIPGGKGSTSLVTSPTTQLPTQLSVSLAGFTKHASVTARSTEEDSATKNDAMEEEEEEEEEDWDGQVFSESELEELMLTAKISPVVQAGKDFFDTEGNFLYRI